MKIRNNKKGFTLVELLAVIVILALIMSVAVVSMSSVMDNARRSTMKETAAQIISGVRQQLIMNNATYNDMDNGRDYDTDGVYYFFNMEILEKGGTEAPLGGKYQIIENRNTGPKFTKNGSVNLTYEKVGTMLYRAHAATGTGSIGTIECTNSEATGKNTQSFVYVKKDRSSQQLEYSICLLAGKGNYYLKNAKETALLGNGDDADWLLNAA